MDAFEEFIEKMTEMVNRIDEDASRVMEAERLVSQLIAEDSWLSVDCQVPNKERYARHSLYRDPENRFEVIALVWMPGQKTPIHDHDGTWGVEGVISGKMRVSNYLQIDQAGEDRVQLRHSGTMTINEQSTGQLLPPADCHVLEAVGEQKVITIHVYGKQLTQFKIFEPLEEKETYKAIYHDICYTAAK